MSETKKRLGKGLNSLISSTRLEELEKPDFEPSPIVPSLGASQGHEYIRELPLSKIQRNPHQPRQSWDESKLFELAESINANGLIQPVIVRPMGDSYQLIAGERRLRAMRMAGKTTISAIVRPANEEQLLEWALIENIHRDDLNPIERARAYQNYLQRFSLTQKEAAQRLGEDRSTIANYARLMELSDNIKDLVAQGKITMGHARALLGIADIKKRQELAETIVTLHWSVRETEKRIQVLQQQAQSKTVKTPAKTPHILELEQEMTRQLGTRVTINTSGRKGHRGKIIIEFYNLDDFDRIKEQMKM
jgi:ParB family chromosome partitioning protein